MNVKTQLCLSNTLFSIKRIFFFIYTKNIFILMTNEEKRKYEEQLDFLYNESKTESGELYDTDELVATSDMFGIELTDDDEIDYKQEQEDLFIESKIRLTNMASLYLDDNPIVLKNKYIKNKIDGDARNLADMNFLQIISKRTLVKQMQQMEMGEFSPRHIETMSMMVKEMRENIKQSTTMTVAVESTYKEVKNDILTNKITSAELQENISIGSKSAKSDIVTTNNLNDYIENLKKDIEDEQKNGAK
jgi:hypothetical protein